MSFFQVKKKGKKEVVKALYKKLNHPPNFQSSFFFFFLQLLKMNNQINIKSKTKKKKCKSWSKNFRIENTLKILYSTTQYQNSGTEIHHLSQFLGVSH